MPSNRLPRQRPLCGNGKGSSQFSAAALEAFAAMRELETKCTCEPRDWAGKYWGHKTCAACEGWWDQHSILWSELGLRPWEWPAIQNPDAVTPYPAGSPAAEQWQPDLEAQERYRVLAAAVDQINVEETTE